MTQNITSINRRTYLKTTGLATAGMVGLAGCTGDADLNGDDGTTDETDDDGSAFGTLSTSVTDQPNDIDDFEELIVTINGIWIKPASADDGDDVEDDTDEEPEEEEEENGSEDGETEQEEEENGDEENEDEDVDEDGDDVDESEGRRYIEFDEPQEADLVQLQGDNTQLINEVEVETGDYLFLQLDVSNTEGILADDGAEADVETPGNAPLQFQQDFEIRADEETRFIADFAPMRRGQGSYIIRPVASGTQVLYGDEEYTTDDEADETDNETADGSDDGDSDTEGETNESGGDQSNESAEDN